MFILIIIIVIVLFATFVAVMEGISSDMNSPESKYKYDCKKQVQEINEFYEKYKDSALANALKNKINPYYEQQIREWNNSEKDLKAYEKLMQKIGSIYWSYYDLKCGDLTFQLEDIGFESPKTHVQNKSICYLIGNTMDQYDVEIDVCDYDNKYDVRGVFVNVRLKSEIKTRLKDQVNPDSIPQKIF